MNQAIPELEVSEDAGLPVVECLFSRASDSKTMSLFVRTSSGTWLRLDNPSSELAGAIQRGVSDPKTQVRAYTVGQAVGVSVRCVRGV
jgi:hypothetical protein